MSLQIFTVDNPRQSFEKSSLIDTNLGGISNARLIVSTNKSDLLEVTLSSEIGSLYNFFVSREFRGLRVVYTDTAGRKTYDKVFVELPKSRSQQRLETGEIIIKFESVSSLLQDMEHFPRISLMGENRTFNSVSFFSNLVNDKFFFRVLNSVDKTFYSNIGSAWDALNQAVEQFGNFAWRELGMETIAGQERCVIEVGDPRSRPFKGYKSENVNKYISGNDGLNILSSNLIERISGASAKALIPRIANVTGADPAIVDKLFITDNNFRLVTLDSDYPLVDSGMRVKTLKGETAIYKVVSSSGLNSSYADFFDIQLPTSFSSGGIDLGSRFFVQQAYEQTILALKKVEERSIYEIDFEIPFILSSGEPFEVYYIYTLPTNEKVEINGRYYVGDNTIYDLSQF